MRIGDIDVVNSILNLESDVRVLQQVLDFIMRNNPNITKPTTDDILTFRNNAVSQLKEKYPNMGIEIKR